MLSDLLAETNLLSGETLELCYHCHKCTVGCPVVEAMEHGPDKILLLVSLDQRESVLTSKDIWLCAGCFNCATHCPNDINIAAVMDALRQIARRESFPAGEREVLLFHQLFLGVVQRLGRSHEAAMLGLFKVLSRTPLMNDVGAGVGLFLRGKVPILPSRSGAASDVGAIFKECHPPDQS